MPDVEEIDVHYSRKVQLEQFEPIQHSISLTASLEDDEDVQDAYDELVEEAEDAVERGLVNRVAQHELSEDDE